MKCGICNTKMDYCGGGEHRCPNVENHEMILKILGDSPKCNCQKDAIMADCPVHMIQVPSPKADFAHQLSELIEEYRQQELRVTYPHSDEVKEYKELTFEGFAQWLKEYK